MGVAGWICCRDDIAVSILPTGTAVNQRTTVCKRTKGIVAVGIGQRIVHHGQSKLPFTGEAAIDKHILVFNLSHRRSLEETEYIILLVAGNQILDILSTLLQCCHRGGIEFRAV